MKNILIAVASLVLSNYAFAEGFVCHSEDDTLNVKVYNHTQPEEGTRSPAVMIVSDPSVQAGRKTIAKFWAGETLEAEAYSYVAEVDLRYLDSRRKGENIAGTKLGQLAEIRMTVDKPYASSIEDGTELFATLYLVKRNGEFKALDMICSRYLKN